MTYRQALDYMYSCLPMFHRIGPAAYKANLDNTIALCKLMGNPQHKFKSVHIAGTNGKGSVSHMTASVLQEADYKTGLCTSPHLKDFRERIRINGKKIPRVFVSDFMTKYKKDFELIQPSFFEMTIALTFLYFATEGVDVAVLETGLGGRLDSTNVVIPELSVITNVSFDHTALLGNTLQAIAAEKAGIIKPTVPVVIGERQPEVESVFVNKADANGSPYVFADDLFELTAFDTNNAMPGTALIGISNRNTGERMSLTSPLAGVHQRKNTVTVMAVCHMLAQAGYQISSKSCIKGISKTVKNTGLMGRWQVLSTKPLTIADTAHNEAGIAGVVAQIKAHTYKQLHIVLGMVNDKEIDTVLSLLPQNAHYYFCKPAIPRGLDTQILQQKAEAFGLKGQSYSSVGTAFEASKTKADAHDFIFIGGSTFVVAEVV